MACRDDGVSHEGTKGPEPLDLVQGYQEATEGKIREALLTLEGAVTALKACPNGERARHYSLVRTNLQQALLWIDAMDVLS